MNTGIAGMQMGEDGRKPYLHLTINTGDCGTVDHTHPRWLVEEWTSQVERVGKLLAEGGGPMMLAGGVFALVSSTSDDDGQMAFTLKFDENAENTIIGSYCDNPAIGRFWLSRFTEQCSRMLGWNMPPNPFPPGADRLDQPWLTVAYPLRMMIFFGANADRYPLSWTQYEQLLVDAWQTMTPQQKRAMRCNAGTNPIVRKAFSSPSTFQEELVSQACEKCASSTLKVTNLKTALKQSESSQVELRKEIVGLKSVIAALEQTRTALEAKVGSLSPESLQQEASRLTAIIEDRDFRILELEDQGQQFIQAAKKAEGQADDLARRNRHLTNLLRMNGISPDGATSRQGVDV